MDDQNSIKKRGRPSTGEAISGAERTRRYRDRLRQQGIRVTRVVTETHGKQDEVECLRTEIDQARMLIESQKATIERLMMENRELGRELDCLKAGKKYIRPRKK
jgi:SMC interacting uncharacterized protein involved in chromosome segregation